MGRQAKRMRALLGAMGSSADKISEQFGETAKVHRIEEVKPDTGHSQSQSQSQGRGGFGFGFYFDFDFDSDLRTVWWDS